MDQATMVLRDGSSNPGTTFDAEQRRRLGLTGRLPAAVETLDEQAARAYRQLSGKASPLERYISLALLHDRNETLY